VRAGDDCRAPSGSNQENLSAKIFETTAGLGCGLRALSGIARRKWA
jgi:hypothetical protein